MRQEETDILTINQLYFALKVFLSCTPFQVAYTSTSGVHVHAYVPLFTYPCV